MSVVIGGPLPVRVEVRHNGAAWLQGDWEGAPSAFGGMFKGVNVLTGERVSTGLTIDVKGRTFHKLN